MDSTVYDALYVSVHVHSLSVLTSAVCNVTNANQHFIFSHTHTYSLNSLIEYAMSVMLLLSIHTQSNMSVMTLMFLFTCPYTH